MSQFLVASILAFLALIGGEKAAFAQGQLTFATDVTKCPDGKILVGLGNTPMAVVDGPTITYPYSGSGYAKQVACGPGIYAAITTDNEVIWTKDGILHKVKPTDVRTVTVQGLAVGNGKIVVSGVIAGNPATSKVWYFDASNESFGAEQTDGVSTEVSYDRGWFYFADRGKLIKSNGVDRKVTLLSFNPSVNSASNLVVAAASPGTSRVAIIDETGVVDYPIRCQKISNAGYEFACVTGMLLRVYVDGIERAVYTLPAQATGIYYDGIHIYASLFSSGVMKYRLEGSSIVPVGPLPESGPAMTTTPTTQATIPPTATRTPCESTVAPNLRCSGCSLVSGVLSCTGRCTSDAPCGN